MKGNGEERQVMSLFGFCKDEVRLKRWNESVPITTIFLTFQFGRNVMEHKYFSMY